MSTHAYKRFVERYGYEIPRGDIRLMEAMIAGANLKSPNAVCLGKRTRYRSEWLTMYKDVLVRFAYSNKSGTIITFLPVKAKHTVCWEEFKHLRSLVKKSRYVCKQCGRFYNIRSDKAWVKFFCTAKNKNVHLVRYKSSESI